MWYLAWYYFDTKKLNKAKEYGDLREKIWIFPQNTKQICLVLEKLCRVGIIPLLKGNPKHSVRGKT